MQVATYQWLQDGGWREEPDSALDSPHTLVVAFGAPECPSLMDVLAELRGRWPTSHVIGCSTSGEILARTITDATLTVAVCRFERTAIRPASAGIACTRDSRHAGVALGKRLLAPGLRAAFVLSDGLHVNGSELLRGLNDVLPEDVVVTGGLAGDGDRFERTWVLDGSGVGSNRITAIGFYGDHVHVSHGSRGGWDIFGPERLITRAEDNVLYELDGRPALELYKRYLGDRAAGLPATALLFPLSLRDPQDPDKTLVRTILGVDEDTQSLTFAGDMPQGALAQLMRANFDRLIEGAFEAAWVATADKQGATSLAIAISCVGRRIVLGERAEEEVEAAFDALEAGTHMVGFYSYGEMSPYASGRCDLHNQTMTMTQIWEG